MKKINNLQELEAERERLLANKAQLEKEIKHNFTEIKESLEPLNAIRKGITGVLSSKNNDVLSGTAGGLIELLLRNVVMRKSGLLTRLIVPLLVKNAVSNTVSQHKSQIMKTVASVVSKLVKPGNENKTNTPDGA